MSSDEGEDSKSDSKPMVTLRSLVSGPEAGSIIGKKGESIKNMREESKAHINVDGDSQYERIVTVEGKTDSVFKAYTMICKVLENRQLDPTKRDKLREDPDEIILKLLIPSVQAGCLIGKGGETIKEMRSSSGADINFNTDPLPGSTEREMRIRGKREKVTKCIYSIVSTLLENPAKAGDVRLYRPMSDRDRDRDRMFRGDRMDSRIMGGGYRGGDRRSRRDESPRWGGHGGGMMGGGGDRNALNILADFARSHSSSRAFGPGGGGSGGGPRDTKFEMYVNNDQVGAVIGKRGSKIIEIRQLTGAFINICEVSNRSSDPDRERCIEISGTHEQVALAKSLINVAIEFQESGGDRRDRGRGGGGGDIDRSRSRDRGYDRRRW